MKITAFVFSVVAASRQARDLQSLFNKMLGERNNGVELGNKETDYLYDQSLFYMISKGRVIKFFETYGQP